MQLTLPSSICVLVTVYKDTTQEYNVSVAPSEDYDIAEPVTICLVVKFGDENVADYFSIDGQ